MDTQQNPSLKRCWGYRRNDTRHTHMGRQFAPVQFPPNNVYDTERGGNDLCTTKKKNIDGRTTTNPQQSWIPTGTTQNTTAAIQHTHTTTRPPPPPSPPSAFFHSSPPPHSYLPPSPHGGSHAVLFTGAVLILLPLHMYTHTHTTLSSTQLNSTFFFFTSV